jgi:protein gp37
MQKVSEVLRNTPKHHFGSNGSRLDALQFWYPKIMHSGLKHKFSSFYMPKVSEVLRNTPKHHFGFDGIE